MAQSPKHIIVGLSGGVDSSVTAYLLKAEGHHVEAIFMKNWEGDDTDAFCPAAQDMADAQAVCDQLKIDLHMVNFADRYWESVFSHFLQEYRAGRTPNPDILCNREIKFKAFLDYAKQRGADYIATGHYVRSARDENGNVRLLKGSDSQKDQSYFLYALDETQLAQSLFPVGDLPKTNVRTIARELGLQNHAKKDSTGICFIGERKFKTFLNDYLPAQPGFIETLEGEAIGTHDGLMFYTIGQRQGLQIGGKKNKAELPWYVAAKDIRRNVLVVVQGEQHPALFKQVLRTTALHWINSPPPRLPLRAAAKTRYRQPDQPCLIEEIDQGHYEITFDTPQRAVTPGQSVVFYQDAICLGGGIIEG
ncbi:tRNA 2-thiouridine(34) synthase MnmA [Aquicella lusitana]|uniref:tRNA-specific 2-thiouridylase MnmA n=1 Tax=Aquicella lusitana TaxID=254246 RepID=A0A370H176_9COXI|nr:tRNA 2-thiouridine(34) synthase MnmA [Aquicella lusitana]RDI48745.1 tRNA (5-methylaminomethyl-2-thiouridylate)-methyltransferase [Aquicella lusitana]VVC73173.1 tRNA-specific 2-thiouridylase MnmA [Aquicella lusitana]